MAEPVTQILRPALPAEVVIHANLKEIGFTPRELRQIKEQTGRSWAELIADETDDTKFAVFGWLQLRREGHTLDFAEMDDIVIRLTTEPVDPTSGGPPETSPASASSGG